MPILHACKQFINFIFFERQFSKSNIKRGCVLAHFCQKFDWNILYLWPSYALVTYITIVRVSRENNFCNRLNSLSYDSRVRFRLFRFDLSRKNTLSFATFIKVQLGQMHISFSCVKQCDTNP